MIKILLYQEDRYNYYNIHTPNNRTVKHMKQK